MLDLSAVGAKPDLSQWRESAAFERRFRFTILETLYRAAAGSLPRLPQRPSSHTSSTHALTNSLERGSRSAQADERFRFCDPLRNTLACDPYQEVTESVIEFLDMR